MCMAVIWIEGLPNDGYFGVCERCEEPRWLTERVTESVTEPSVGGGKMTLRVREVCGSCSALAYRREAEFVSLQE